MGGGRPQYRAAPIEFFEHFEKNEYKTQEAGGVPQFDRFDMIRVFRAGGQNDVARVSDQHKLEYPEQWRAYQANKEQPVNGTPIEQWPMITVGEVAQLRHWNIKTVEQLSELSGEGSNVLGTQKHLIKKAKEWLKNGDAPQTKVTALEEALEREKKRVADLEEKVELLMRRIEVEQGVDLGTRRNR